MEFHCPSCNYGTSKKCNYEKHLTSKKHRLIERIPISEKKFTCNAFQREPEDLQETIRLLKRELELQRQEFTKRIEELEQRIPHIEIHDSFNTVHLHMIGSELTEEVKLLVRK